VPRMIQLGFRAGWVGVASVGRPGFMLCCGRTEGHGDCGGQGFSVAS
jgi:hypothetical protein